MIAVEQADPGAPASRALLEASYKLMTTLFSPDENHFLSVEALRSPDITFWTARRDAAVLGCIALARKSGYGELKSLFVEEGARGLGIADALIRQAEDTARSEDLCLLRLETGDALSAALAFYRRHGFEITDAFGDYTANGTSIFMEKSL